MSRLIEICSEEGAIRRFDESALPLAIGGEDVAQVVLPAVSGVVAYVGESRDHLFLQPADGRSLPRIYHNDELLSRSVWLKSGDRTRIDAALIEWQISGRRLEARVVCAASPPLRPPAGIPPANLESQSTRLAGIPVTPAPPTVPKGGRSRALVGGLFVLLLACAAFVLLATPLTLEVSPVPERLSVSGFPPVVRFGGRYLGLPGRYVVHAEKAGYRPLAQPVEIARGGSHHELVLEKLPGLLGVESTPAGATLLIDGVAVGTTPLQDLEVAAGDRLLRLELLRYLPYERTVAVEGFGHRQSLRAELQPGWATAVLATEPAGALLSVDGVAQGVTPLQVELLAGLRQLTFSLATFTPLAVELPVTAGETLAPPPFRLLPAPARLTLTSNPPGATVSLDGDFRGQTPLTLSLSPDRPHKLGLRLSGYLPEIRSLTMAPAREETLAIDLVPEYGTVFIVAEPPGATLTIDGKPQPSSNGRFRLTTRPHTLELRATGYQTLTREVTPRAGVSQRLELRLASEQGRSDAAPAPLAPRVTTALGQELVLIKPTAFLMGASRREPGRRANEAEHQVALQRSFYIATHEVTNRAFRQFRAQHSSGRAGHSSLEIDDHPAVNLSWDDAVRFLNWLSVKDGLPPFYREEGGRMLAGADRGVGYRLPTEAEWAYVARVAGRKEPVRYPWAGSYPPQQKVANFADEAARQQLPVVIDGYDDGFATTAPVGSFAANPVGVYDLGGNVAEWCHDYYAADHGQAVGKTVDSLGAASGTHRAVRGSSWRDASITELRFSYRRFSREPASDIGFRIVRYAR